MIRGGMRLTGAAVHTVHVAAANAAGLYPDHDVIRS